MTNVIEVGGALNQGFPFSPLNVHFCVQPQAQRCSIPSTRGDPISFARRSRASSVTDGK